MLALIVHSSASCNAMYSDAMQKIIGPEELGITVHLRQGQSPQEELCTNIKYLEKYLHELRSAILSCKKEQKALEHDVAIWSTEKKGDPYNEFLEEGKKNVLLVTGGELPDDILEDLELGASLFAEGDPYSGTLEEKGITLINQSEWCAQTWKILEPMLLNAWNFERKMNVLLVKLSLFPNELRPAYTRLGNIQIAINAIRKLLLGGKDTASGQFSVNESIFVPQQPTESLVESLLEEVKDIVEKINKGVSELEDEYEEKREQRLQVMEQTIRCMFKNQVPCEKIESLIDRLESLVKKIWVEQYGDDEEICRLDEIAEDISLPTSLRTVAEQLMEAKARLQGLQRIKQEERRSFGEPDGWPFN